MKLKVIDITRDFASVYPSVANYFPQLDSDTLWAMALYVMPDSPYKMLHSKDKKSAIDKLFKKSLDWETIEGYVNSFVNVTLPREYRFLIIWERELEKRLDFIQSIDYSEADPELIKLKETMLKDTHKMWEYYEKCRNKTMESGDSDLEGDSIESLSESGVI